MPPRKQQPRGISCSGKSVTRCGEYILNSDDAFVWEDPDYDDSPAYEPLAEETDFLLDIVPREEAAAHAKCAAPSSTGGPGAQNPPQAQQQAPQAQAAQQPHHMGQPDYSSMGQHPMGHERDYRQAPRAERAFPMKTYHSDLISILLFDPSPMPIKVSREIEGFRKGRTQAPNVSLDS